MPVRENATASTDATEYNTTVTYTCVTGHVYFHDENTDDDDTTSETAWCSHTARWWNCVDGECDADFTDTPLCGSE